MPVSIYDISIPVFVRRLGILKYILQKGEQYAKDNKIDPNDFLTAKLAPDMRDLIFQVRVASDSSKGLAARLTGTEAVSMEDNEKTFDDLYKRIDRTVEVLNGYKKEQFEGKEDITVSIPSGRGETRQMNGLDSLLNFAIPNFFFHVTTAYDILRSKGVPLGKKDFLAGAQQ